HEERRDVERHARGEAERVAAKAPPDRRSRRMKLQRASLAQAACDRRLAHRLLALSFLVFRMSTTARSVGPPQAAYAIRKPGASKPARFGRSDPERPSRS